MIERWMVVFLVGRRWRRGPTFPDVAHARRFAEARDSRTTWVTAVRCASGSLGWHCNCDPEARHGVTVCPALPFNVPALLGLRAPAFRVGRRLRIGAPRKALPLLGLTLLVLAVAVPCRAWTVGASATSENRRRDVGFGVPLPGTWAPPACPPLPAGAPVPPPRAPRPVPVPKGPTP